MQHDEIIWQTINQHFCSFKVKTPQQNFCRNKDNVTGLCNRSSCPLANSRYATIHEEKGICYLWIKTIERAHSPKNMWEKIPLSRNYAQSLKTIDEQLAHWPNFLIHKNKQRLTKIHQYLIRMRKLKLKNRVELVTVNKKKERQQRAREGKALRAAHLTSSIKNELLARLSQGTYGDIYNFPQEAYKEVLDDMDEDNEDLQELDEDEDEELPSEFVEAYHESDDDIEDQWGSGGYSDEDLDLDEDEDEDDDDDDDDDEKGYRQTADDDDDDDDDDELPATRPKRKRAATSDKKKEPKKKKSKRGGRGRIEVEYEQENEDMHRERN